MPARDIFHDQARHALEKESWIITHDQFFMQSGGVEIYIDLGAECLIAAQKDRRKIAVEVKSFVAPSVISEFHTALLASILTIAQCLRTRNLSGKSGWPFPPIFMLRFFNYPLRNGSCQEIISVSWSLMLHRR